MNTIFSLHSSIYSSVILPEIYNIINIAKANSFYIPQSRIFALNKLVKKLKYYGIWNTLDGLWIGVYNDINAKDFTRINLKYPSTSLSTIGVDTIYNVNGWRGSGTINSFFETFYDYDTMFSGKKYLLGDSNITAVVNDVSAVVNLNTSLICSGTTSGVDTVFAFNTASHRQNSNVSLDSSADLSGVGFKSYSKNNSVATLYNKNTQIIRSQANTGYPVNTLILLRNSTVSYSRIGLSFLSIGGSTVGLENTYRDIFNEYLVEIGLTAYA